MESCPIYYYKSKEEREREREREKERKKERKQAPPKGDVLVMGAGARGFAVLIILGSVMACGCFISTAC